MKKKLFASLLAATLAFGAVVSVGFAHSASKVEAASGDAVNLSAGKFITADPNYISWDLDNLITITQNQGFSTNAVNSSYVSGPRMYKGHYLRFETIENVTISSIEIVTTEASRSGQDITYQGSPNANGAVAYGGTDKPVTGYETMTSDKTMTFVFDSARSVVIQNSYADATSYEQIRISTLKINYVSSVELVMPTEVQVNLEKTTLNSPGETAQATATVLPAEAYNKTVVWSSSNPSVASVNSNTGLVTAESSGTADIIATCAADNNVTGRATVTVNIVKTYVEVDALLDKDTLALTSVSYADNNKDHPVGPYTFTTNQVMLENKTDSIRIQLQKTNGYIENSYPYFSPLKRISIHGDVEPVVSVGSTSADTKVTGTLVDGYWVYDIESSNAKFFRISAGDATTYLNRIFVEITDGDVEKARSYAQTANSVLIAECSVLNVTSTTWNQLSELFSSLTDDQQAVLRDAVISVAYTDIQQFLQRYEYIVNKYGYTNFIGRTITTTLSNNSQPIVLDNFASTIIIATSVALSIAFVAILANKKKKRLSK